MNNVKNMMAKSLCRVLLAVLLCMSVCVPALAHGVGDAAKHDISMTVIYGIVAMISLLLLLFYILYHWQRKGSIEDSLRQLQEEQNQSFSSLQEQFVKSAEELKQKLHPDIKYEDFDQWATIPDSVDRILEVLEDEFYYSKTELKKLSRDTIRINIQTRLKENHVEYKKANNAHFYRTIDIAAEMAKIFTKLQATTILAELKFIASPGNDLQRAKKQKL